MPMFCLLMVIGRFCFAGSVTGAQHNFFFSFFHASKSRRIVFKILEGIFFLRFFCLFGELKLGEKLAIFRLDIIGRLLSLPSSPLIHLLIPRIIPTFRPSLRLPLPQPLQKHVIVNLIQLFLQDILSLIGISTHRDLDQTVQRLDLDLGILVRELVSHLPQN